jgi:hypothetical protein
MKELGRSLSWHYEDDGPQTQVRMFVCGFLTQGAGRLPAMVTKFYDRRLQQRDRIMLHYIGQAANGCHMYWVNVKLPAHGEASNDDEEVNRMVMRDIVAKATEDNKQAFIEESRRIIGQSNHGVNPVSLSPVVMEQESSLVEDNDGDQTDFYRDDLSDKDENEERSGEATEQFNAREFQDTVDRHIASHPVTQSNSATVARLQKIDDLRRTGEHIDRSVVTVDGACSQIQSLCGKSGTSNENGVIHEFMAPLGNDVIKASAACSMAQNPNDAGRCHSQLKSYVRTKMKWNTRHTLDNMKVFIENVIEPLQLDKGSLNTVLLFCGHLENMICKVWQPATIRAGWIKSGLVVEGCNSDGGIDLKRILSHWIGFKDLEQNSVQSIVSLIPTMALEVVASTVVSDASMQQFERFFPRPFINYKKDRADMSTSRGRSRVLLANQEMHKRRWSALAPVLQQQPVAQLQEPPPHHHGWKDEDRTDKADRICDCKQSHISGARFYKNNSKAWADHQKTLAHQKWVSGNVAGDRMQTIGAAPFQPFSDHEFASRCECRVLAAVAKELSLTKAHADKFAALQLKDTDSVWLAQMMPGTLQTFLGLPLALSTQFSFRLLDLGEWRFQKLDAFYQNCYQECQDDPIVENDEDDEHDGQ